jgi:hypothetical protein
LRRPGELEEVSVPIIGGLDIHRKQLTFDYLDTVTGEVYRGQIVPADRAHLRAWLTRFAGRDDVGFALEGCTGWRYVTEELTAAGCAAHLGEPADTAAARGPHPRRRGRPMNHLVAGATPRPAHLRKAGCNPSRPLPPRPVTSHRKACALNR